MKDGFCSHEKILKNKNIFRIGMNNGIINIPFLFSKWSIRIKEADLCIMFMNY